MAWTWLLSLAPVADDLFKMVQNVTGKGKRSKELNEKIKKKFIELYNKANKDIQRDVTIITGWKQIVAHAQGVEAIMRSWEVIIDLAQKENNPKLALKVIQSSGVKKLKSETEGVLKKMRNLSKDTSISWREGGADLESAVEQMIVDMEQLVKLVERDEKRIKDGDNSFEADDLNFLGNEINDVRTRVIVVANYWDSFLAELSSNAAQAPKHFLAGIDSPVKDAIEAKYDDTRWSDILNTLYKAVAVSQQ